MGVEGGVEVGAWGKERDGVGWRGLSVGGA